MRRFALCLLVSIVTFVAVFAALAFGPSARAAGCPGVAYFAVGGTGDPYSTHVPGIPRGAWVHRVGYPADVLQGDWSRHLAATRLDRAAWDMRHRCPGTHISVRAHSLGASAASLSTDGWIGTALARNTDVRLYGDPRRPGTRGEGGIETVGLPHLPGYTMRGPHRWAPWIVDVCHVGNDIICSSPRPFASNPMLAATGIGGYFGSGHTY